MRLRLTSYISEFPLKWHSVDNIVCAHVCLLLYAYHIAIITFLKNFTDSFLFRFFTLLLAPFSSFVGSFSILSLYIPVRRNCASICSNLAFVLYSCSFVNCLQKWQIIFILYYMSKCIWQLSIFTSVQQFAYNFVQPFCLLFNQAHCVFKINSSFFCRCFLIFFYIVCLYPVDWFAIE